MKPLAFSLLAGGLAIAPCASAQVEADVLGRRPAYSERAVSDVPNAAAMTRRFWSPGLNEGFVPQGVTFLDGAVFIATYRSDDPSQGRGPCRVYRLDPDQGTVTGSLDLPAACGHAGGLAKGPAGRLWVADTRVIFEIGVTPAGTSTIGSVLRSIRLEGSVKGSFAAGTADALWLGTYSKEPGARLYKFPFARLGPDVIALTEADAETSVAMPPQAQGAAFDARGYLWITRSGSRFGELVRIDLATGAEQQRFAMPAGIEDISFEPGGAAWSVSEAGSKRWLGWQTFFPVVFRLDMSRLR